MSSSSSVSMSSSSEHSFSGAANISAHVHETDVVNDGDMCNEPSNNGNTKLASMMWSVKISMVTRVLNM
jgi:hypothetical protein